MYCRFYSSSHCVPGKASLDQSSHQWARRSQPRTSGTHSPGGGVPICTRRGPHSRPLALKHVPPAGWALPLLHGAPHSQAAHLQPCTDGSIAMGRVPSSLHGGDPTRLPGALNHSQTGPPLAGLASSPAYGGVSSPGDQARSTAHGVFPIRSRHTLNHAHHSRDWCPSLHMKDSPVEGRVPSTPKKRVPTRGPRALNWAWRSPDTHYAHPGKPTDRSQLAARRPRLHTEGFPPTGHVPSTAHAVVPTTRLCAPKRSRSGSHPRAVRPRTHTEGFQLAGHTPSTAHGVVLTTRLCALNSHEGRPHSWATSSQLGTERFPLADPWAVCLHPCTQWSPPQRCVPSSAHAVVPTRRPWALNWARRASHPRTGAFNCTRSGPHLRAVRPQPHTEGTPLSGHWPSTGHGGVPTHGT